METVDATRFEICYYIVDRLACVTFGDLSPDLTICPYMAYCERASYTEAHLVKNSPVGFGFITAVEYTAIINSHKKSICWHRRTAGVND